MLPQRLRAVALALACLAFSPIASGQELPPLDGGSLLPDLIGTNLETLPQYPHVNGETRFCVTVRNIGDGDVLSRFDVLFLINNRAEGTLRITDSLRAGHAVRVCKDIHLAQTGQHQWTVHVDSSGGENGEIRESDETNNIPTPRTLHVSDEPRPELLFVAAGVIPRVATADDNNQLFHVTILNAGNANSTATHVDFIIDHTDPNTRVRLPIPALRPGEDAQPIHRTIPNLRQAGNYTVEFVIDPENVVAEWNETNNVHAFTYEVAERPTPDFVLEDVNLTGETIERRTMRLDARVVNRGDERGAETIVRLLAVNETGHERIVANASVPRLAVGHGHNVTLLFTLSNGSQTLRLVIDPLQRVPERDKTNNEWSIDIVIEPPPVAETTPNLIVQSLDASPDDPGPNEAVTLIALVANTGEESARSVKVAFYVDDELIATRQAALVEPGKAISVFATWVGGSPREYVLRVVVDPDDEIVEADKADNQLVRHFLLRAPAGAAPSTPPTPDPSTTPPDPGETPATPPPTTPTTERERLPVAIGAIDLRTSQSPGKLLATAVVQLRNPNLEPLGPMTLSFFIDGQRFGNEVLVQGIGSAATRSFTSGELELPPGEHTLRVDVRMTGTTVTAASSEVTYNEEAGARSVPGAGAASLLLAALGAGMLLSRGRQRRP